MITIPARYATANFADVPERIRKFVIGEVCVKPPARSIYLHGAVGTGKTHIAYALAKHDSEKTAWTKFWNVTELLFEIRQDYGREEKHANVDTLLDFSGLLVLDDIGAEKPTDFVAETLYMLVNNRYTNMFPTIFTSNLPIGELAERIGDRTASRIVEMSEIFELSGGDRRIK